MLYVYSCRILFVVGSILSASTSALAADQINELEEVVVSAHPLADKGLAQPITVLTGNELAEKIQGSLGETIVGEAGINSASFGSAVGRPVIHGLGGARVKTTEDRIDSLDVSVTSGDHAVSIEPFIANQITILKGASTLLYGSGAIGGVVDVETGRIAKQLPEQLEGRVELRAADNANATTAAARLDGTLTDNLAWHVDAFSRDADDYDIPGFVESAIFRATEELEEGHGEEDHEEEGHEEEGHEEGEEAFGVLEGSRAKSNGGALGLSFVGDSGFAGFSVSTLNSEYGLVGGHGHEEGHDDEHGDEDDHADEEEHDEEGHDEEEEEGVGILDMEQTRFDFEAQLNNPFAGVESINFRLGINDYEHAEIEGNGELGTLFTNEAWEGRLQLNHSPLAGFEGSFGLQLNGRDFSAIGEEAFVPPVETDSIGIFWLGQRDFDGFDIELGARFEDLEHTPSQSSLSKQSFNTASASLGLIIPITDKLSISSLFDYSSRAPSIEELYSQGPHLASQTFEVGDINLTEESALAFSLSASYQTNLFELSSTFYHMQFDDFIYQANTGQEIEELPVLDYRQNDADFTGLDAKADIHLAEFANGDFDVTLMFDTVSAKLVGGDFVDADLPRIPATRYGLGLHWQNNTQQVKIDYRRVDEQNDTAEFELATQGYDDISIYLSQSVEIQNYDLQLFLHGRNLSNEEQRNHASIVKDFAPAPGRRFELGLRLNF